MSYTRLSENDVQGIRVCKGQWNQSLMLEERKILIYSTVNGISRELEINLYGRTGEYDRIGLIVDPEGPEPSDGPNK